jgi:hypothetical protein
VTSPAAATPASGLRTGVSVAAIAHAFGGLSAAAWALANGLDLRQGPKAPLGLADRWEDNKLTSRVSRVVSRHTGFAR